MMFDDAGSEFAVSQFYFTVLQLLRIAHDWIQESVEHLKDLIRFFEKHFEPSGRVGSIDSTSSEIDQAAAEVSRRNWESVTSHQQQLANSLLARIARKREEVSSLRDGVGHSKCPGPRDHRSLQLSNVTAFQCDICPRSNQVDTIEPLYPCLHCRDNLLLAAEFRRSK